MKSSSFPPAFTHHFRLPQRRHRFQQALHISFAFGRHLAFKSDCQNAEFDRLIVGSQQGRLRQDENVVAKNNLPDRGKGCKSVGRTICVLPVLWSKKTVKCVNHITILSDCITGPSNCRDTFMGSISFQNSTTNHEEHTKTRMYDCIDFDVRILPDQPGR